MEAQGQPIDLRAEIEGLREQGKPRGASLLPAIQSEGDGTKTTWALPAGMRPYAVFNNGSLAVQGAAEEYTITFDGFLHRVVFAVAPGNGNAVVIWPQEV